MRAPAKRKPLGAVAALEAKIADSDARPRIDGVSAMKYQALMSLANGEEVLQLPGGSKGPEYVFGPLRQDLPAKSAALMSRQGLVTRAKREDGAIAYALTPQGREAADFAFERFPEGIAYPTLKYLKTSADVAEDMNFCEAAGIDREKAKPKATKRAKVAA